jgi:hypothetical protein
MSEKIYVLLLGLYPSHFRTAYGDEAIQLFRDRFRDERGFLSRVRLWWDLLADLIVSLPREHWSSRPSLASVSSRRRLEGAPCFEVLEGGSPRPGALCLAAVLSVTALAVISILMSWAARNAGMHASVFPDTAPTVMKSSSFGSRNTRYVRSRVGGSGASGAGTQGSRQPKGQSMGGIAAPAASGDTSVDATERQHVVDAVVADLQQHYFDPAVAHQMADALDTHQRHGDDAAATTDKEFAALLTAQMREVSHDLHLEVMYTATPLPQSSPQQLARMLTKDNCQFKKVQILPHNIGYLKLNAFLSPSDCGHTATAAMTSLNGVNAVIFDLRDNIGGTSEMVSLIASWLFDHPEYMFDPRRVPTSRSWTSSPVPGSKLVTKPVYILTSSTTISAAEQFTYDLKMLKRATVVGEVTAGGAHAGVWHPIDDHFGVFIPENRAVNPYSQADWEAVGIQPDIKVPAAAALETALQQAQSQVQKGQFFAATGRSSH